MSMVFSRLNVLTPEVHDTEAANPSPPNVIRTRNSIFPGFPTRNPPDVTQDLDDEDKASNDSSDGKKTPSSPEWKKRRTRDDLAALQLREKLKSMEAKRTNRYAGFGVNSQVYTTNALIAPLSEKVPPGKTKKIRLPLFGTIVKRSEFYPRFWLVNFYDGRSFYVTLSVLRLGCKSSPSHKLKRDESNMLQMDKINKTITNDKETILTDILLSKAQFMAGVNLSTYDGLCNLFKKKFTWLTPSLLKGHVYVLCQKLEVNQGTWLSVLPDPFPSQDVDTPSTQTVTPSESYIVYVLLPFTKSFS